MAIDKNTLAQQYARRRAKNLAYFQKSHPPLYERFKNYIMRRVEVAISPAEQDIDVLSDGVSLYGGKAAAVGREEANGLIKHYRDIGVIKSINPPWSDTYDGGGFAKAALSAAVAKSPLKREEFKGFPLNKLFFPQLVFLGCGAGFHIQYVLESVQTINAVVFEPDPELFAASLFCVDWEAVGSRFNGLKGESLVFLVGGDTPMTEEQQKTALQNYLYPTAPMYPYMSVFINHRKRPEMAELMKAFGEGIHKFKTSWLDYDDTLRRAKNCLHNLAKSPSILNNQPLPEAFGNVVIVGSGPSIDKRFGELKANRDRYTLVSAGTGIKGLLENDLLPDYHVELDPDYYVYGYLSLLDKERLKDTVLIAVNEVNPLVPPLFSRSYLYFKTENPTTLVFWDKTQGFEFCNPTVSNAALSMFTYLGATKVFLFGCDLGYQDLSRHHSAASIYEAGGEEGAEVSDEAKKRADARSQQNSSFKVPGVNGTEVFTRGDFFVAKQEMEVLIERRPGATSAFFNCSDGAEIAGTQWLDSGLFADYLGSDAGPGALTEHAITWKGKDLGELAELIAQGVEAHSDRVKTAINSAKLQGRQDLARAIFAVSKKNMTVTPKEGMSGLTADQLYAQYIVSGSIKSFLMIGLAHGMAFQNTNELKSFLTGWLEDFNEFLTELPKHCRDVLCDATTKPENDPWVLTTIQ